MTIITEDPLNAAPRSGIKALIAGAGIAGLLCALECHRNGIDVILLERQPSHSPAGDFVVIGPSARRIIANNWPNWLTEWDKLQWNAGISYYKHKGEYVLGGFQFPANTGHLFLRPDLHKMMINEAKRLGIPILFNAVVDDYFENQHEAGVKLRNGETLTADLVIAVDGTHSKSGKLVHNNTVHATPSGFSVYRTCYPAEIALADPLVKARWGPGHNAGQEVFQFYLGPDSHANVLFEKGTCCWSLFHRDTSDTSDENWSAHLNPEDAIAEFDKIGGWDPALMALVRTTPRGGVNDHRMMWRDPQPVQTSPLGRVAQIGDACHIFLPTSANGSVQAMEDGASLAACLRLGGKDRITLSTRVHALLRFERVSSAQLMGFMTRQTLHHADWEVIKNDSMKVRRGPGAWIGGHDVEQYAIDNFEAAALHITDGTPFANTNLPKNYTYKPWNIQTLNKEMESPDFTVSEILMDQAD